MVDIIINLLFTTWPQFKFLFKIFKYKAIPKLQTDVLIIEFELLQTYIIMKLPYNM